MNSVFSEQILADKLSKLNSTQQCIETLSHWCIFHQSKAEQVVTTWDKQFHKSEMAQKVPLLYLANDILQNSKRKGNEFVAEFWKVLPAAIKNVNENGDDRGKNVISRLVAIWEERRVFGSRLQSLKDVMLGGEAPPPLELNKKRSRSVKITKRDSRSIRTKLSIGGTAEKIVSAFHLVQSEHPSEDAEMSKCMSAVQRVRKIEKDVDVACASENDPKRQTLAKELEEEENLLKQCIEKLKSVEATRVALVSHLKEALREQESELENIRTQMQVAQAQADEACNMRKQLNGEEYVSRPSSAVNDNENSGQTPKRTAASIAAEVADKLAASSSSQMIITSVLSTFAAEEAKNAGLKKTSTPLNSLTSVPVTSTPGSASNLVNSTMVSDRNVFMQTQPQAVSVNQSYQSVMVPQQALQNPVPNNQAQYHMLPNGTPQQYVQSPVGIMPQYGYGNIAPMPAGPPPPPPNMINPMMPVTQQPLQMSQHRPAPTPPSFRPLQPPGMVYYSHPHQTQ